MASYNKIRILLDKTKKKVLKEVAYTIMMEKNAIHEYEIYYQWYDYILDAIDSKIYTPIKSKEKKSPMIVCVVKYTNKGLDDINLQKIMRHGEIVNTLPDNVRDQDCKPMVTYKLGPTIRNKIFNYKETIENIKIVNGKLKNVLDCACSKSKFKDDKLGHIVTGNLSFIQNRKLRKLLIKGPNYREPRNKNYKLCLKEILIALDRCASKMANKFKIDSTEFHKWKNKIIEKVENKIKICKKKLRFRNLSRSLQDQVTTKYLENIHDNFVIVPIDKATNNIAFICKKYYIERILKEIGLEGSPNATYSISDQTPDSINFTNSELCEQLYLKLPDSSVKLPAMYWIPKLHKTPIGARFIIASKSCSIKPISKAVSSVFKLIFKQIELFHAKSKFYSNYNLFWVIQNSRPVIEKMKQINSRNKAKSITTYDFSTLYTNIPHSDLTEKLDKIIDIAFEGGKSKYIRVNDTRVYWSNYKSKTITYFNKNSLKKIVAHLISESYFSVGNITLIQNIGIPMGLCPAPHFANLYLHRLEYEFSIKNVKQNAKAAYYYNGCMRYIDDLCCLNDEGNFGLTYKNIYPRELELKCEDLGDHATFLDLDIRISNNQYVYKIFDKRQNFPFHIVRMPDITSNIPKNIFYGTIQAEILRLARTNMLISDFTDVIKALFRRMENQGGDLHNILKQLYKALNKHNDAFLHFHVSTNTIKDIILQSLGLMH